jgi:hypothetical protein
MTTPALPDRAGAREQVAVGAAVPEADVAAAREALAAGQVTTSAADVAAAAESLALGAIQAAPQQDVAAAADALVITSIQVFPALAEAAGAAETFTVTIGAAPAQVPGTRIGIASPAFIRSQMPRMHVQNLLTGAWWHRDVQGLTSPSVTWALNAPDSFTCTLAPPRPDMMDSSGNALLLEWRDALYLEERDEIKFGGIVTSSTMQGPQWQLTATGFVGYANGIIYEGGTISQTNIDALDAVRTLWNWVQAQPGGNIGLNLGTQKAGVLIGSQHPPGASAVLGSFGPFRTGQTFVWLSNAAAFSNGQVILINGDQYTIKTVEMNAQNVATGKVDLTTALRATYQTGMPVIQLQALVPWTMSWTNSTDIGQEVDSIRAEAIFDYREQHGWIDGTKKAVGHQMIFGVPRLGRRLVNLRFCEGENIVEAGQITRDGAKYANDVIGLGAGQGTSQIRTTAANLNTGRLRRSYVYADQTCDTVARIASKANRILAAMSNIDTVTLITVKNHPNAPWGSFGPGDDIPVMLASGWRNTTIWSRITQMTQDPTTDLIQLTLARSDSFTYMPETGVAGTL